MVKSSIFKLCTTTYKIYNNIYIYMHNLGYVKVLSENAINKVSQYYCVYNISSSVFYSLPLINTRSYNYSCTGS